MKIKALHTADWHVRDSDIQEAEKCLDHVVNIALDEKPDLIIIAGDLTDSQNVKLDSQSTRLIFLTVENLADIAPVVIITGTPSHDGLAPELIAHLGAFGRIRVASLPEQIYLIDGNPASEACENDTVQAVITLFPAVTKKHFESSLKDVPIEEVDREIGRRMGIVMAGFGARANEYDAPHLLVGHWQVGGAYISDHQTLTGRDIEVGIDQVALACADLVCLGHIHKEQRMGENIFYSGSIYRKDWGELDVKGFYIHTIDGGRLESRFIETPSRKLIKIAEDFTTENAPGVEALFACKQEEIESALLRIELIVFQDEAERIDREAIREFYLQAGAADVDIKLIRVPRANVRSERFFEMKTLEDKLAEQAKIKDEPPIAPGILDKAGDLETKNPEQIFAELADID